MTLHNAEKKSIEFGDYQTPVLFASEVCKKLSSFYEIKPDVILEPTFGIGNFFEGIITSFPNARALYGIEINSTYYKTALQRVDQNTSHRLKVELINADVFTYDFNNIKKNLTSTDSLLVIGNPPWVTNSQLSSLGSSNLPHKRNLKGFSGLDAMTGKSNFDIAEYILLLLLSEFSKSNCLLAMLCKNIVAKNIIRDFSKYNLSISSMDFFTFNANEVFGVSCDAGLLVIRTGEPQKSTCTVYDFKTSEKTREFGWIGNKFYSDTRSQNTQKSIDGECQLEWRQGVKHDCSKVMELEFEESGMYRNGIGEELCFQLGRFIYPLIKSSDIKTYETISTRKYVIIPQTRVNEDTSHIQKVDSVVWDYLKKHDTFLSARRSSIYRNAPKYSIFGIGDYSFKNFKVGISGFYKEPVFTLVKGDIPVMMDDTCYFLSFDNINEAVISLALLNSHECITFLKSIAFLDSKRPYTKDILKRIDLCKLSYLLDYDYIKRFVESLSSDYRVNESDYEDYRELFNSAQLVLDAF